MERITPVGGTILPAVVLNEPYASWMHAGMKTIETRWYTFKHRGDIVICCGNSNKTDNAGFALCVVNLYDAMPMCKAHEIAAMIEADEGRISHMTKNLRRFSKLFKFAPCRVRGSFQSIFHIRIPDGINLERV